MIKSNRKSQKIIQPPLSGRPLIFFLVIPLVISIAIGAVSLKLYLDAQNKLSQFESQKSPANPTPSIDEIKNIVKKAGKHILLPENLPQLINVTNVDSIKKDQPFFKNARNGNKLLIYPNKVIIYDPVRDIIIDIAYLKPTDIPAVPTVIPSTTPVPTSPASEPVKDTPSSSIPTPA